MVPSQSSEEHVAKSKSRSAAHSGPNKTDYVFRCIFVCSLCLVSLLYGVVAGSRQLFPYHQLRDAQAGLNWLRTRGDSGSRSLVKKTTVRNHAQITDGALILVSGGRGFLKSEHPEGCLAWLMNRSGEIQHIWKWDPDLWSDLTKVDAAPWFSFTQPIDIHLLEDGGLIATFHGVETWPYGVGIARFDKDSNVIWKQECLAHHWFEVTEDDRIIVPTMRVREGPLPVGSTLLQIAPDAGKVLEDTISTFSLNGELLEEISVLDAVHNSGLVGLYSNDEQLKWEAQVGGSFDLNIDRFDPLHLNAVRLVGEEVAAEHDWLEPEDLLVSFREVNSVAILDPKNSRIKWICTGRTLHQHSPCFLDSETLLVFDNLGGDRSLGGTRLVKLNLNNQQVESIFPTQADPQLGRILSTLQGHLDLHPEKKAVLMTLSYQSRIFEIDLNNGQLLWEYTFGEPELEFPGIATAKYCYDVSFPMNRSETKE